MCKAYDCLTTTLYPWNSHKMTLRVNRNWKNKREHPHHAEHADTGPFPSPRLPFHSCRHRLSLCGQKPPEFVAGPPTPARHHPQRPAGSDLPAGGGGAEVWGSLAETWTGHQGTGTGRVTSPGHGGVRHAPGPRGRGGLEALRCPRGHGAARQVLAEDAGGRGHVREGGRLAGLLPGPAVGLPRGLWGQVLAHPLDGVRGPWARR